MAGLCFLIFAAFLVGAVTGASWGSTLGLLIGLASAVITMVFAYLHGGARALRISLGATSIVLVSVGVFVLSTKSDYKAFAEGAWFFEIGFPGLIAAEAFWYISGKMTAWVFKQYNRPSTAQVN